MGTKANLKATPYAVYIDESGLQDIGYTKGGLKIDITPKVRIFTVDQLGDTPAKKVLNGCEAKLMFSFAENTLINLKRALLNGVPLQDDTTPTKQNITIRPKVGLSIPQKKWVFKPINAGVISTDQNEWITIPAGELSDAVTNLILNGDDLRLIPVTLDCMPWEAGTGSYANAQIIFGDDTVVDANESGF